MVAAETLQKAMITTFLVIGVEYSMKSTKYPWYVWLSIIGFAFLWENTKNRTMCIGHNKSPNINLWLSAQKQLFYLLIVYFILPEIVALLILEFVEQFVINISLLNISTNVMKEIFAFLNLVVIYCLGVHISRKYYSWMSRNFVD